MQWKHSVAWRVERGVVLLAIAAAAACAAEAPTARARVVAPAVQQSGRDTAATASAPPGDSARPGPGGLDSMRLDSLRRDSLARDSLRPTPAPRDSVRTDSARTDSALTGAPHGDTLVVALGERAWHGRTGLTAALLDVSADSRCPANATCVAPGTVDVRVRLTTRDGVTRDVALALGRSAAMRRTTIGTQVVELVGLTPYPGTPPAGGSERPRAWLLVGGR